MLFCFCHFDQAAARKEIYRGRDARMGLIVNKNLQKEDRFGKPRLPS